MPIILTLRRLRQVEASMSYMVNSRLPYKALCLKKSPLTQSRHTLICFLVSMIMYRWFILIKDEWEAYSVRRRLEIQYNH